MKKLTLHLGLHRCASTTLQSVLKANRAMLADRGIGIVLRADMEASKALDMRAWHRRYAVDPRSWTMQSRFTEMAMEMPFEHLIVSEENLIGTMPAVSSNRVYPNLGYFLHHLKPLKKNFDLQLRFVVRRQDRFVESVYAFRVARGMTENFRSFLSRFPPGCFDWRILTKELDKIDMGDTSQIAVMDVWPRNMLGKGLADFVGADCEGLTSTGRGNRSVSKQSLPLLLALNRSGIMPDYSERKSILLPVLGKRQSPSIEDLTGIFSLKDLEKIERHYRVDVEVGFTETARTDFLAPYKYANAEFLNHPTVVATTSIW